MTRALLAVAALAALFPCADARQRTVQQEQQQASFDAAAALQPQDEASMQQPQMTKPSHSSVQVSRYRLSSPPLKPTPIPMLSI